jgi:hypothetical protein
MSERWRRGARTCLLSLLAVGCGGEDPAPSPGRNVNVENPLTDPESGPPAGNADGGCAIPEAAGLADTSTPDHVVGTGTPESCSSDEFVAAVAQGGVITFDCGPDPVTIMLDETAKIFNDASDQVVIDGAGKITLSGTGNRRILYMNTCDEAQHWTTSTCQNQPYPELTVQNLTFVDGSSRNETEFDGGGAIWVRGGRFKLVNTRFFNNVCADTGPDLGGAAVRVFSQYQGQPVHVVNSTFGGADGLGGACSNGGGISSIGVSWTIINSLFSHNRAVGNGGNPAESGTPGGGKRRRHLQRRQHHDAIGVRHADRKQPGQRLRQRHLLRLERSFRHDPHHGLDHPQQHRRRMERAAGHLDARRHESRHHELDDRMKRSGPRGAR